MVSFEKISADVYFKSFLGLNVNFKMVSATLETISLGPKFWMSRKATNFKGVKVCTHENN
jgi:hypothetical protein